MAEPEIPEVATGPCPADSEPATAAGSVATEREREGEEVAPVAAPECEDASTGDGPVAMEGEAESEEIAPVTAAEGADSSTGNGPVGTELELEPAEDGVGSSTGHGPVATERETESEETAPVAELEGGASSTGHTPVATMAELLGEEAAAPEPPAEDLQLRAVLEAIVYVAEEPLPLAQLAAALNQPRERIEALMGELIAEFDRPMHGVAVREVAGGYKMTTKPEHHEAVRNFVRSLKPPLKLSLAALETLAVIAYKQPITAPEIMEIRGVQGAGVLKTLLDRKLIASAGRKNVIGKPILYKTTKEFLVQFGLKDLAELPSLKEFEELRRLAFNESEPEAPAPAEPAEPEPAPPEETSTPEA